ncbi:GntR family transcriptional regulator [Nonomuraea sp. M3C6]|uniref:GntR family transcriptional regulator n=1 Tax=Nonomuraea marmarensis TaxID=3351344 RepID=A0ABW7AKF9_9ACTN
MTASPRLPPIGSRPRLRTRVAHALRAALVAGQLGPGEIHSAPVLAARFGVSATPVREAMLDLVKEGLVEIVPNKGFRVTELSDRQLDEITDIRLLLEVPTTVRAAASLAERDLAELRTMAQLIVAAAREKDLIAYVEHDRRFHLELLSAGGNRQLLELVGDLRARSRLYGLTKLADSGELTASALEHVQLLDLIAAGDLPSLDRLIMAHIGHVRGSWAGRDEPPRPA